jgi:4-amino-4-deoxy-L-arabinose transferase-like glycosyltransferase
MLSPKYPPVLYLVTAGVHTLLGPGPDIAIVANAIFGLILLIATYGLGGISSVPKLAYSRLASRY